MCNNFQALEIYVQTNIASCVLGRPKCFRHPKTTYRYPTLQSRADMMLCNKVKSINATKPAKIFCSAGFVDMIKIIVSYINYSSPHRRGFRWRHATSGGLQDRPLRRGQRRGRRDRATKAVQCGWRTAPASVR